MLYVAENVGIVNGNFIGQIKDAEQNTNFAWATEDLAAA
jgi:hypothetical protein